MIVAKSSQGLDGHDARFRCRTCDPTRKPRNLIRRLSIAAIWLCLAEPGTAASWVASIRSSACIGTMNRRLERGQLARELRNADRGGQAVRAPIDGSWREFPAETLHDKVRGGLLGQMLSNLNGLPHEMKYIA